MSTKSFVDFFLLSTKNKVKIKPNINKFPPFAYPWKYITADTVKVNSAKLVKIGHGEGSTKWYGWAWKLLLLIIFYYF